MKIQGVIFDWAGTTIDFGCMAPVRAFMDSFADQGIVVTEAETRKPMGLLKRDHIRTMLGMERIADAWRGNFGKPSNDKDIEKIYTDFEKRLLGALKESAKVKPGVLETVAYLRSHGYKIGSTTGYTDKMMEIVVPAAEAAGYKPDFYLTPDAVGGKGRPYPYMIFHNMEVLGLDNVRSVVKVGDTVADIREGKAAGVWSVGVVDGSSVMGLSEEGFKSRSEQELDAIRAEAKKTFLEAGADYVIKDMTELPALLAKIEQQLA
ncbi:MAG: phosphonoacetaldehyde hydrolase [Acidaminococcus sp.]|nr:phosphonoacetaldehyde hydrolase [Acidaminococcus sp.]MCI2100206.1 phosphonoacetaldehyde hydrolase [Acidaminococcus sp.]MCI2114525.1 phosphonoacetaldehyde hydrolase [Acidaminococcus sp.]MCI2116471.1 phosphonoacetaldehyde hydrolase [Acidaminococcus sp.]